MNLYVKNCPRSFLDYIFHVSCTEKLSSAKFFRKSYLVKLYFYKLMNLCPVADAEFQLRGGLVLPLPYLHSFLHLFFLFFSHISPLISMEVLGSSRGARAPSPPVNLPLAYAPKLCEKFSWKLCSKLTLSKKTEKNYAYNLYLPC